ncbi:response regulator transcription factor [Mariprofundus sp. EBB-1]|uniref:response regulator transcription factor n=1 Tax=Mariprofundus sp. EBB-1 TaxID=2650971 RepID=UPI001379CD01|nr:response regulator transcription factor [Mariprofundus sp. EBB-1]
MIQTVLILDDQPHARAWLRTAVEASFPHAQMHETASLAAAREALLSTPFNLFLCDLGLPDGNGLDLLMDPSLRHKDMITVVSTIHDEDEYLFPALRFGIQGYILKDHPTEEIAAMLERAVSGDPPVSPAIARKLLQFFHHQGQNKPEIPLSKREEDVLRIVSKGYTTAEAAGLLDISQHTAREYLKSCYRKLEVSSRSEATLAAIRLGLTKA